VDPQCEGAFDCSPQIQTWYGVEICDGCAPDASTTTAPIQIAANDRGGVKPNIIGTAGEQNAIAELRKEGYEIIGTQVAVTTSAGKRVYDILVRAPDGRTLGVDTQGDLIGVESKATTIGRISLKADQVGKDESLIRSGGYSETGQKVTGVLYEISNSQPLTNIRPQYLEARLKAAGVRFRVTPFGIEGK
jgi:hypothetical protein